MRIDLGIPELGPAEVLGSGGFGTVYRAEQLGMNRAVAVKVLQPLAGDPGGIKRFERERNALGAVADHPHIVSVFDWGLVNDRPYLVMELLPGGTLAAFLERRGPLAPEAVAGIGIAVADGLAAAHERGVLHRDVKPENILISAYGKPVLCDFGIARLAGASRTVGSTLTASLAHAAPEVIAGEEAGGATDVWSLASTLATLAVGRPPFLPRADEAMPALVARILTSEPPDLAELGVHPDLARVLQAGLMRDVRTRTPSAADVRDQLQAAADRNGWRFVSVPVDIQVPPVGVQSPPMGDQLAAPTDAGVGAHETLIVARGAGTSTHAGVSGPDASDLHTRQISRSLEGGAPPAGAGASALPRRRPGALAAGAAALVVVALAAVLIGRSFAEGRESNVVPGSSSVPAPAVPAAPDTSSTVAAAPAPPPTSSTSFLPPAPSGSVASSPTTACPAPSGFSVPVVAQGYRAWGPTGWSLTGAVDRLQSDGRRLTDLAGPGGKHLQIDRTPVFGSGTLEASVRRIEAGRTRAGYALHKLEPTSIPGSDESMIWVFDVELRGVSMTRAVAYTRRLGAGDSFGVIVDHPRGDLLGAEGIARSVASSIC